MRRSRTTLALLAPLVIACGARDSDTQDPAPPGSTSSTTGSPTQCADAPEDCTGDRRLLYASNGGGTVRFPADGSDVVEAQTADIELRSQACSCCGSWTLDSACSVTVGGGEVVLDAFIDVETRQNDNPCWTCTCTRDQAVACEVPPLTAGLWVLKYGDRAINLQVPGPAVVLE